MRVRLTGGYEGQDKVLLGVRFVGGIAQLPGGHRYKALKLMYNVEVIDDGERSLQTEEAGARSGTEVPLRGDVPPRRARPEETAPHVSRADDGDEAGSEREVPGGDGHGHPRLHEPSRLDEVGAAIGQLDPLDSRLWTKEGRPRARALSKVLGRRVTRAEIEEKVPVGTRQEVLP